MNYTKRTELAKDLSLAIHKGTHLLDVKERDRIGVVVDKFLSELIAPQALLSQYVCEDCREAFKQEYLRFCTSCLKTRELSF